MRLCGSLTNTATAGAEFGGAMCTPSLDSVDVTVTAPPQGSFDCSDAKPIDELTMTWNGLGNVHVIAYDGSVGGTVLADTFADDPLDPVAPGEDFSVSGMGGSPNDQQWEIYDATNPLVPVLIGVSQFHISCSDDNMNGVEDCDKSEGNGKGDDAGLIDDWLLEGMSGDQALVCTPGENIVPPVCGIGPLLALIMPGLMWLRRRRLRREA